MGSTMLLLHFDGGWPSSWREAAPSWERCWTALLGTRGSHDTALCLHDAQPCRHLAISTGTFGFYQACTALPVSPRLWVVGKAGWSSLLSPLLLRYKLSLGAVAYWCVAHSPAAERSPPCRMTGQVCSRRDWVRLLGPHGSYSLPFGSLPGFPKETSLM